MKRILKIFKELFTTNSSSFYYIEEEKAFKRKVERNALNTLSDVRKN
jgi:hypothetical protein